MDTDQLIEDLRLAAFHRQAVVLSKKLDLTLDQAVELLHRILEYAFERGY